MRKIDSIFPGSLNCLFVFRYTESLSIEYSNVIIYFYFNLSITEQSRPIKDAGTVANANK